MARLADSHLRGIYARAPHAARDNVVAWREVITEAGAALRRRMFMYRLTRESRA